MPKLIESRFVSGPNDKLAVADVYEVTESAVRNRAAKTDDGIISKLSGTVRVPTGGAQQVLPVPPAIAGLVRELLQNRVASFVSKLPPDQRQTLRNLTITDQMLGYAPLDMIWDYAGELVGIDPNNQEIYGAVRAALQGRPAGGNYSNFGRAIDQGAEAIVYADLLGQMMGVRLHGPMRDILRQLSTDQVRRSVSEATFPRALNPQQRPGHSPRYLDVTRPNGVPVNAWEAVGTQVDYIEAPRFTGGVTRTSPSLPSSVAYEYPQPGIRDNHPRWQIPTMEAGSGFDFGVVEELLTHTTPERLLERYPGLPAMILYYYELPKGSYDVATEYHKLTGLMDRIQPGWSRVERDGKETGRLLHFASASKAAGFVLSAYPESSYREEVLIAGSYQQNGLRDLLLKQYPGMAL